MGLLISQNQVSNPCATHQTLFIQSLTTSALSQNDLIIEFGYFALQNKSGMTKFVYRINFLRNPFFSGRGFIMNLLSDVLKRDTEIAKEVETRVDANLLQPTPSSFIESTRLRSTLNNITDTESLSLVAEEAVVLWNTRPSLPIQDDAYGLPDSPTWRERLSTAESKLRKAILATGRIELLDHPFNAFSPFFGTGWLIAEDVIVTNRHVAEIFVKSHGNQLIFSHNPQTNQPTEARIDFKEELGAPPSEHEFTIIEIIAVEPAPGADAAFFRIKKNGLQINPIELVHEKEDEFIAAIGYPGKDHRADPIKLAGIFKEGYGIKRLAPGQIMPGGNANILHHDASTLKGSSGSVIISLETGKAVGLHFAGVFGDRNSAVKASELKRQLTQLNILPTSVSLDRTPIPSSEEKGDQENINDRQGYQPDFLGADATVPLPNLNSNQGDAGDPLHYTHFSLAMHNKRKLALYTACNIDGTQLRRIPRSGRWRLDGRIEISDQHGNELYRHNDYDRGHLVRRLSPVWGDFDEAKQANDDTFFYTNAAPQHKRLNQKFWLGLEDHILDKADAHDMRVSVFTGCVFDAGDPKHRGVQIPRQFWKIVAFNDRDTNRLRASGYLMDQSHLIADMPEEFSFGAYKTYQVSIGKIQSLTNLDLQTLIDADVLNKNESFGLMPLTSFEDIQF